MSDRTLIPITGKLPIWQFLFAYRPRDEEQRFREYYLDADIRQILTVTLTVMAMLAVVTITDIRQFSEIYGLSLGAYLRIFLLCSAGIIFLAIRRWHSALAVDVGQACLTLLVAICIVAFYAYADISAARIGTVVTLVIIVANIAYPVYALYLMPGILVLTIGSTAVLMSSSDPDFVQNRALIIIIFAFAELFSLVTSAYWQHNRYFAFRALVEVKTLSGMIPICSNCKKIRDDSGYYQQLEQYISTHSDAQFSHGICPACINELYPSFAGDDTQDRA